jgi:hypothetical protein
MVKTQSQTNQEQPETNTEYKVANEEINESLILRSWKGVLSQVQRVREFNASQNVLNVDNYIGYIYDGISRPPMSVSQKIRWLNIITQKKTGAPRTVDHLIASGQISDIEKEMFGQGEYPRIECHTMTRVKTIDDKEYLVRGMRGYGISEIGGIVTLPLYDCDFTRKVPISAGTAKNKDGNDVKILIVGSGEFSYETSPKIYLTPWSNGENARATLEKYPLEDKDLHNGKMIYMFKREDTANEIGVSEQEFFSDFDSVWNAKTAPKPTISIDSKTLANYATLDRESREKGNQYG